MKKTLLYFALFLISLSGFAQADIKVINTDYQDVYVPGSTVVYSVSVMNFGPTAASNVRVVNALPSGIFDFKWTGPVNPVTGLNVSGSNNQLDHTIATLAVGEVVNYTIKIKVPNSYTVNLVNETVISGPNVDPDPVCLQCKDIDVKGVGADILVTNTNNQTYYTPGTTSVYTLKVKNNGPLKAVNVSVFSPIPAGITNFSWTGSNGSVGTNVNLSNSIFEIAKDATVTYTITLDIPIGFTGNLVNQSSITSTSQDLNLTNNSYTETDLPVPTMGSDIVITNTDNKLGYNPGGTNTYLIKVKNNGPEPATNLQIANAIPEGITEFSWTGNNGSSGTNVALDDTIATLAVGAEVLYTIVLQVPLTRLTDLTSETVLTSTNVDPNPNNSQYIDNDVLINTADVSVINTDNQAVYIPGGTSVYTITVKNNGPHNAANVKIVNTIPAVITQFSWTGSNGSSGTNTALNNTIPNLLNGDTVIYTVTLQVPLTYTGNLTSTVVETSPTFDPTSCTQCVDVDAQAANTSADVIVTNTDNTTGYTIGETKNYVLTVKNNGPANATNVVVTNPRPTGINTFSWSGNSGSGTNDLNNTIPLLLVGQSITYNITLVVPTGFTGDIVSQAATTSTTVDPNLDCTNCIDIDSNTVIGGIKVVNTDNSASYIAGQPKTYIITVTNNGPTTATNIVIQDLVSNGLSQSDVSWSGNATSGTGDLNDTIASLAVGQTVTYTIIVNIPSNYNQNTSLINHVTFTSDVPASNPPCLQCLDIDTPNPFADLVISKSDNRPDFLLSQNGNIENNVYTIVIANNGPSDAVNVLVSDIKPPGITVMSWSSSNGTRGTGSMNDLVPSIPAGSVLTYSVTLEMPTVYNPPNPANPLQALVNLTNTVTVTSPTPDPSPNCPKCTDIDVPRPDYVTVLNTSANLTVTKLLKEILINSPCIETSNFSASAPISFGYFNSNNSDFPIKDGVIIRNGIAKNTEGKASAGMDPSSIGSNVTDTDLSIINVANGNTGSINDASFVKFNFKPANDVFSFNFLFASNEYGQYQCGFSDAFAFILTDVSTGVKTNLAVVPSTTTPVSVTSIRNAQYNGGCASVNSSYFGKYNLNTPGNPNAEADSSIAMRGQTVKMTASADVIPNTEYSIKLVIGDYTDTLFDSAVFIEAGSFKLGEPEIVDESGNPGSPTYNVQNCSGDPQVITASPTMIPGVAYSWKKDGVVIPGETMNTLLATEVGTYTVTFTYAGGCSQSDDIVIYPFAPVVQNAIDLVSPFNVVSGGGVFNLTQIEAAVVGNLNPTDFIFTYYLNQSDFDNFIAIPDPTNFIGTNNQEIIYSYETGLSSVICRPKLNFRLFTPLQPVGTFEYAEDGGEIGFCRSSTTTLTPTTPTAGTPLTSGGQYSIEPNNGIIIDPVTGVINLTDAIPGEYTVTYQIIATGNNIPYVATAPLKIILCTDLAAFTSAVCGGSPLTLTTSDAGSDVTYTWSDGIPAVIGTTTLPTLTLPNAPTVDGTHAYSVVASYGTINSASSSENLTVNAVAEATITTLTPGVCIGGSGNIIITGTPNANFKYTIDGGAEIPGTIGTSGSITIPVSPIVPSSIYRLVSVERNLTPNCPQTFAAGSPGSFVTITPDGPNASVGILNPNPGSICQNGSTTVTINGNAGATVHYSINNAGDFIATLDATTGSADILTGILTSNTTYELLSITDNSGSIPCTKTFASGTAKATVTVNPLPTITGFSTTTDYVCTNTKGKLTFTGTSNSTIEYSDGNSNYTVVLNGSGPTTTIEIDTPNNLTANTTFSLVSITTNDLLGCQSTVFTLPSVSIQISNGPSITTQPAPTTTICEGGAAAVLTVAASGASLSYQWYDGPTNVGTNSNTLSIPATLANNGKTYQCIIADNCGVVIISEDAIVNVTAKPVFTQQPQGTTPICVGESINLSVITTGVGVTYKWFRGTTDLSITNPTALSSNLIINNAQTSDSGVYKCEATTCSGVNSNDLTITVNPLPTVTAFSATNASICTGTKGALSFTATPNSTIVYSDGISNYNVSTATGTVTVPTVNNLSAPTTFTLVSITNNVTSCVNTVLTTIPPVAIGINALPTVTDPTPSTTLICSGDPATTLTVAATGAGLTFVWKKGSAVVPSSNSSSISVPSISANTGDYSCTVTDVCGQKITSNTASLIINDAPIVTEAPTGNTICSGTTINLRIVTTGIGLTYQWKKNGVDLPTTNLTAITSNLIIVNAQVSNSGDYTCVATSGTCSVTSPIATMIVNQAPQITTQPASNVYCSGDDINLSVGVTPTGTYQYQWQLNDVDLVGETNFELQLTNVSTTNSGNYICLIDNLSCKQIKSNKATILVKPAPFATIQTQVPNTTVCAGSDSNLVFNGTPNAVVTYNINGGANQVLNLNPSGAATIITTGILATNTTYQLVSVSTNDFSPVCTTALTDEVTINVVAIPELTLATDGFICVDENNVTQRKFKMETGFSTSQYTFQWYENNIAIAAPAGTSEFYEADKATTYKVEITDSATGCKRNAMTNITSSLQPNTVTATVLSGYFEDNATIEITADPANGDFEYQLDNGPFQDSNVFINVPSGNHYVHARDKRECKTTAAFSISIVNYPKFFTPNGDGVNDFWNISSLFVQSNAKIYIFDRFGKLMKQISTTGDGWDGNFNGSPATADDYWFVIKYEEQKINKEFKAHFTLKR